MISRIVLAPALFCLATLPGFGALIQVSSPAELPGPLTLHNFESGASGPGATYSAPSGVQQANASSFANDVTPSGSSGLAVNDFPEVITITFQSPVTAFGLWFGNDDTCCSAGFTATLSVFDGANALLGTVSLPANMNDGADQFLGFTSTDPVGSVQLDYGAAGLYTYIDDVQFGASAVPEPATVFITSAALAGLAWLRRRRS